MTGTGILRSCLSVFVVMAVGASGALAQTHHHAAAADSSGAMPDMPGMPGMSHPKPKPKPSPETHAHHPAASHPQAHAHQGMKGMSMAGMAGTHHDHAVMRGMYGPYPMTREASGTSWQPDRALHQGWHTMRGSWSLMVHGMADLVYDHQGGGRGDERLLSANMVMGMAQRDLGPGHLGFLAMMSAEPATIDRTGYPLLLQTGETANGRTPLIDRQHPHDLFMELAGTYSLSRGKRSAFLYGGLPGEPALGPPAFMHRFSAVNVPLAPITHHWLDSSHITFGVLTAGVVLDRVKLEASAFRGREPNENRWDIETPKLDSHAFRLSWNPAPAWSLQLSRGRLNSPEQLEPDVDVDRTTGSAIYATDWKGGHWESMLAWGQNKARPGPRLDAVAVESAVRLREKHTIFARVERVKKDELFPEGDPRSGQIYGVGDVLAGYRCDVWRGRHVALGLGALGTIYSVPAAIRDVYGRDPESFAIFTHAELR